ncbi:MAG: GNAT family N-acetyltransferase [Candidatus Adiutricales bacterium]
MSEIVTDLSPEKISRAIDANQIEGYTYFGQGPQAEIHKESDLLWFVTGIPHPILNGVLTARFTEETLDRRIESTLNYFKSRGLPMMWWTGPATEPFDLADHLLAHGMTDGGDQPGMALDLGQLEQNRPQPEGLIIGRVNNVSDLGEWLEPVRIGFELPDFVAEAVFNNFSRLNPKKDFPWRHYLGKLDGRTVAAATLFLGAGVAGIYHMATLPQARRRGIASAMTLTALLEAREIAFRIGVLQSSNAGRGVYQRLGFKTYCSLGRYILI